MEGGSEDHLVPLTLPTSLKRIQVRGIYFVCGLALSSIHG